MALVDRQTEELSVLILAGGLSRRMGRDKAWMELSGSPLVERVARRVMPLADELVFSTNSPDQYASLLRSLPIQAQLVMDQNPGLGPLAGIAAGLGAARHDLVLVLAVDMPFTNLALLSHMAELAAGYDAVVPLLRGASSEELRPEPLHAFYRRSCLAPILRHLEAGHRQVVSFLPDVQTRWVSPDEISLFDPTFDSFRNINTPADWDAAQDRLAR